MCCRVSCNRYKSRVILQDMLHEILYYDARIGKVVCTIKHSGYS